MERTRAAPPRSADDAEVPSLPEGPPSLKALIQEVLAPGAARADVDALLTSLARPPPLEPSRREHADLLLSLIEDPHIGSFTGSEGRTVRAAAVLALVELGYPYALEVPPDALEAHPTKPREATDPPDLDTKAWIGLWLMVGLGLLEISPFILGPSRHSSIEWGFVLAVASTNILPASLTALGRGQGLSFFLGLGLLWLLLAGVLLTLGGVAILFASVYGLIPLGIGILTLVCTGLLTPTKSTERPA